MDSRGNKGDTQGKPYENSTGDPCRCSEEIGTTGGYKETKIHWVGKGVGVAHSTDRITRTTQP